MITFVYNEIKYLPHVIDYYRSQGCEIYIIDNYSNDGTWEWLLENNIPCHRCDTNEEFAVETLQRDMEKKIHELKPDWVMFGGGDLYFIVEGQIKDYIAQIESKGYNQLALMCITPMNTGEPYGLPLCKYYFNATQYKPVRMISKYDVSLNIIGDTFMLINQKIFVGEGVAINYGACKTIEEQEIKLQRTRKAWESGTTRPNHSTHYPKWKARNWITKKENTFDLRESEYFKYIKKIC